MSGIEVLVVAFGLFIGYWVVAKLLAGRPGTAVPEWHDTLGVSPHASVEQIEAAHRALTDRYQRDELKAKEIAAAYRRAMQARGTGA